MFEGNFPSTSPWGAYIWKGDLTEGFLRYLFGGRIFGGAYAWRGLFSEFYGMLDSVPHPSRTLSTTQGHFSITEACKSDRTMIFSKAHSESIERSFVDYLPFFCSWNVRASSPILFFAMHT